jgi:hypothetical protein
MEYTASVIGIFIKKDAFAIKEILRITDPKGWGNWIYWKATTMMIHIAMRAPAWTV